MIDAWMLLQSYARSNGLSITSYTWLGDYRITIGNKTYKTKYDQSDPHPAKVELLKYVVKDLGHP